MATSSETVDLHDSESRVDEDAKLVVVDGCAAGREYRLVDVLTLGSGASCTVRLDDPAVSRLHARIDRSDMGWSVTDAGSRNGTFVGGTRVKQAILSIGTVISVGTTKLVVYPGWRRREVAPSDSRRFGELYGESTSMREAFAMLEKACRAAVNVLIEGETGTGKELAARAIHHASLRAKGPFVVFDCAAVPPTLAESELFGHVRGAFSGAATDRPGAFEQAQGGTLMLDELGELPAALQPKLLRILESRELKRVGGNDVVELDVRIVGATNRDLHSEVKRGRFRADLLYRLDVVRIRLPPLRHRPEDIPGLVTELLMGRLPAGDEVAGPNLEELMAYDWPGNVRELRNVLHRAVTMASDGEALVPFRALVFSLRPSSRNDASHVTFPGVARPLPFKTAKQQLLADFERAYVDALLDRHDGNLTQAAAAAGLSRKHLHDLVRKSGASR